MVICTGLVTVVMVVVAVVEEEEEEEETFNFCTLVDFGALTVVVIVCGDLFDLLMYFWIDR